MGLLQKIIGTESSRLIKKWAPFVDTINKLETEFQKFNEDDFKTKTAEFKQKIKDGTKLDDLLPEAFALVREASVRIHGERHYDVQLLGGIALHKGIIAEMRTGEGKTLVATLPAYLNALTGLGIHIVTVNDYLSRRDAVWMGPIFSMLGLSVAVINSQNTSFIYDPDHQSKEEDENNELGSFKVLYEFLRPCTRKEAYSADITYGTNNEFGFDYLRDNLATNINDIVQRNHYYAIVDEVDSILIDESRTPLIISSQAEDSEDLFHRFSYIQLQIQIEHPLFLSVVDESKRSFYQVLGQVCLKNVEIP